MVSAMHHSTCHDGCDNGRRRSSFYRCFLILMGYTKCRRSYGAVKRASSLLRMTVMASIWTTYSVIMAALMAAILEASTEMVLWWLW